MDSKRRASHPSSDIKGQIGKEFDGKKIVLCVTGSVAAYRSIDLARLLMRHGADVHIVMTESVKSTMLSPEMAKWATGNDPVTKLTGDLEHIMLADYGMSDLIIVYPCTANTIGKMANGIDDTPVTSVLSVALGSKIPVVIAPAMHQAMYENEIIKENIYKLKNNGVKFLDPTIKEGKAKVISPEDVLTATLDQFKQNLNAASLLKDKNILVTAGSTVEYIDPIRIVTNQSSGKMGNAIAQESKRMGANVTLIYGHCSIIPQAAKKMLSVSTTEQMYSSVISEISDNKYDIAILAAAVADFTPSTKSAKKLDTRNGPIDISLLPTPKIIDKIKKINKKIFLVAFKADYDVEPEILIEKAYKKLKECNADLIVANDIGRIGSQIGSRSNEVYIINRKKDIIHVPLQTKENIANKLLHVIVSTIGSDKNQTEKH